MRMLNQVDPDAQKTQKASPSRRRSLLRDESGQSLVVVVIAMFTIIAFAAMAIDLSAWYQKHHQAQVAADSAALAAANCEASGKCNDATATQTAVSYAATNSGVTIPSNDVTIANKTVTVTTPLPAPSFFAAAVSGAFGNTKQTAVAKASWATYGTACGSGGNPRCAFIFANDNSCSGAGVTITTNGSSASLTGSVISNSNISWSSAGTPASTAYATENVNCGGANGSDWSGKTTYTVSPYWPNDWPINYANVYPPCGTGLTYQCTGPGGTPSYCTKAAANFGSASGYTAFSTTSQFYCAYGTSTNYKDPTTWNGTINVTSGFTASTSTFIGGTISISSTLSLGPYSGSNLLAWATGTADSSTTCSANAVDLEGSGNSGTISGDLFAPNGGACVNIGGNEAYSGFIQANDVVYSSHGTDTGKGPITSSSGGDPAPPSDSLSG